MQWALFSSHLIWFLCRSWPWCRPHHFWKLLSFLDTFDVTLSCFSYLGQLFFFFFLFIKPSSFYFSKMILSICLYLLKTNLMNTNLFPTLSSWINEISSYLLNTCIWISSSCADTNSCKVHFIVYPSNLEFILRPVLWKRSCEPAEVLKPDNLRAALSYSFLVVPLFCSAARPANPSQRPLSSSRWNHLSTALPQLLTKYTSASPLCPSHISSNVLSRWPF